MNSNHKTENETTNFGFHLVTKKQKTEQVTEVFSSVAPKYDLMNDLMSLGLHRVWKKIAIQYLALRTGHIVLDLAGGTGDLTKQISKKIGFTGKVTLSDINPNMLQVGKNKLIDAGIIDNVDFVIANAEDLPFYDFSFDRIIIGFGLRNITNQQQALQSMYRVLKPGGKLVVLEFSKPVIKAFEPIYTAYLSYVLPTLGEFICNDRASYQYLGESIQMHHNQTALQSMLEKTGFERCSFINLSLGIVAIHVGTKLC